MLRFEYGDAPFAGDFVEFSDSWTRREMREFVDLSGDEWLALTARKVSAVRLGDITDPAHLTVAAFDDMDLRLYRHYTMAASAAYVQVGRLGEAVASRLSATFAAATQTPASA